MARAQDPSPVVPSGLARSVTVEDSFRSCLGMAAAESVLSVLAPDLVARLEEEAEVGRGWASQAVALATGAI